jgi:1,2-phenylacetyl-CoA epoxidase PaaB subunit
MAGSNGHRSESWEVFARQDERLPIRHIGTVDATNVDDPTAGRETAV